MCSGLVRPHRESGGGVTLPVAVANEDDVQQVFHLKERGDVLDMGVEFDVRPGEMLALAQAGERRGEYLVPGAAQERPDEAPAPAAVPGAVHQHERGHA
jgi:hypothetical protein